MFDFNGAALKELRIAKRVSGWLTVVFIIMTGASVYMVGPTPVDLTAPILLVLLFGVFYAGFSFISWRTVNTDAVTRVIHTLSLGGDRTVTDKIGAVARPLIDDWVNCGRSESFLDFSEEQRIIIDLYKKYEKE
jgi:hypothetical protein